MESTGYEMEGRPLVLRAVDKSASWGSERWLNGTRAEGQAIVANAPGLPTLADVIAETPALLGEWSRRLFGDELPIFTKLLRADFPPLVHVGFRRAVDATELLVWLAREQALLRQILGALEIATREHFDAFMSIYTDWATLQARVRWQSEDEASLAERLRSFVAADKVARLAEWLGQLRRNRAQLVDVMNEVDLEREDGNLILTGAGVVHSIFGLSHQTHPLDHTGPALTALFRQLRWLVAGGATDGDLRGLIDAARLPAARALNRAAPKNEAWLPLAVGGRLTLVEPQQSSDTTYSLADFYTPFVWDGARPRFRKGDPRYGLCSDELSAQLRNVKLEATSLDDVRRVPVLVPEGTQRQSQLFRLVDDPTAWPFFSAYRVELAGTASSLASWRGDHGAGRFQQLVVTRGEVELVDADGASVVLGPSLPAFIPATMHGGYRLSTSGAATVLIFSVPGPRGPQAPL